MERNQAGKDQMLIAGRGLLLRKQRGEKSSWQIGEIKLAGGRWTDEPLEVVVGMVRLLASIGYLLHQPVVDQSGGSAAKGDWR